VSATVFVTLQGASPYFAEDQYCAPAGEAFTLKITNSMFTLGDRKPVEVTVVISPADDPAIAPVPGRPGWFTGSTERASFLSAPVTAPHTGVFTVPALAAGTYLMQIMDFGPESSATLIVQSTRGLEDRRAISVQLAPGAGGNARTLTAGQRRRSRITTARIGVIPKLTVQGCSLGCSSPPCSTVQRGPTKDVGPA
jgi:hypothetical protein